MPLIQRWVGAVALGAFCALLAWQVTLAMVPRALMAYAVDRVERQSGGINRFAHAPLVTAQARTIVRPSPDLLYSSCAFDVSRAPLLIDAVPVAAPYWSLSVFDAQTDAVFVANNQAGYRAVPVSAARGIALVRILIDRTRPIGAIDAARRATRCRPAG